MKLLQHIVTLLIIVGGLFLVIAFVLPKEFTVKRQTEIKTAPNVVYQKLLDLKTRAEWDPRVEKDAAASITVLAKSGPVNSSWMWEGEKIGAGKLTIKQVAENKAVWIRIDVTKPVMTVYESYWKIDPVQEGTMVTWTIKGPLTYPLERYRGLVIDRTLGSECARGLELLKIACERSAP